MTLDQFRDYCLSKRFTKETTPFDDHTLVLKVADKIFAITDIDDFSSVNLKVEPEYGLELKERYSSVAPAYHMNKKHWVTVMIGGDVSDRLLMKLIDESYELVVSGLSKRDRLLLNS